MRAALRSRLKRRSLSMTSLIDIIFLLLMFFMLSSSFTRTVDLPLSARAQGVGSFADTRMRFLRIGPEDLSLDGRPILLGDLAAQLLGQEAPRVLVSLLEDTTSQRLTDVLIVLRAVPSAQVQVLG